MVDRKSQKRWRYDEFWPENASQVIARITQFANQYGVSLDEVSVEGHDDCLHLCTHSLESIDERNERIAREEKLETRGKVLRRQEYERLKKEFDGDGSS